LDGKEITVIKGHFKGSEKSTMGT